MPQVAAVHAVQLSLFDVGPNLSQLRSMKDLLSAGNSAVMTETCYRSGVRIYRAWCASAGRVAAPADSDTVALFVVSQLEQGLRVCTVDQRLLAVVKLHKREGFNVPNIAEARAVLTGARRQRREGPGGKKALQVGDLAAIAKRLPDSNAGVRDRALLVLGFAAGLRRSELARLDVADVSITARGVVVDVRWSKTDQEGKGRSIGIFAGKRACTDPVRTLRAWLQRRGRAAGPLFTRVQTGDYVTDRRVTGEAVNEIVQRCVAAIGLESSEYGAHSLRAGMVTAAAERGLSDREIMQTSGHRTVKVMERYIRHARAFPARNPLAGAL